jgi:DNA polymerase
MSAFRTKAFTRRWERQYTYSWRWAENVTQAVARDLMREAMFRVEAAGYPIILTVHDELVTEPDEQHGSADEFNALVATLPA